MGLPIASNHSVQKSAHSAPSTDIISLTTLTFDNGEAQRLAGLSLRTRLRELGKPLHARQGEIVIPDVQSMAQPFQRLHAAHAFGVRSLSTFCHQ